MNFLITAGPTREKIDPVRFLTNLSSGKMGYALADAAFKAGHDVVLISGVVTIPAVKNVKMIYVESAADMFKAVLKEYKKADIIIMSAAVADFTPIDYYPHKLKKNGKNNLILELERTVDILAYLGEHRYKAQKLIGFAAESENVIENAKIKLKKKNLDWIIANNIGISGLGFQVDNNAVTMISRNGHTVELSPQSKRELGKKIVRIVGNNPP
jgi:phosphopantothenoylcysteine decarboxylase / phosphopantothenate---cysteine ligase